jgi:DNA-binding NarL/FixJ family response regulator
MVTMNIQSAAMKTGKQERQYILIIEDHPDYASAIEKNLLEICPNATILKATAVDQAWAYINSYHDRMQLVTVDLGLPAQESMPDKFPCSNGIKFVRELLQRFPEINLMILSNEPTQALSIKDILLAHQGGVTLEGKRTPLERLKILAQRLIEEREVGETAIDYDSIQKHLKDIGLDQKCRKVLEYAGLSYHDKYIATLLDGINIKTVRNHWGRIYAALNIDIYDDRIDHRALAIDIARQKGLI